LGVPRDLRTAADYFRLAAVQHWPAAQNQYGEALESGVGVVVNLVEAAKYYRLAAEHKVAAGQFHYGHALQYGLGVEVDVDRAVHYLKLSADQGVTEGFVQMAHRFQYDPAMELDLEEAYRCYEQVHGNPQGAIRTNRARSLQGSGSTKAVSSLPRQRKVSTVADLDFSMNRGQISRWRVDYRRPPCSSTGKLVGWGGDSQS
jgi:TPR repeat protein